MAILESLAGGLANAGINYSMSKMFAQDEQKQYEKNQSRAVQFQQELQRNSYKNMAEGLRLAGLSPALLSGGMMTAPTAPTAPMQNKSPAPVDLFGSLGAMNENSMLDSQKKLMDAQASKTQAEADKTNIDVGRMTAEDKESKDAMLNAIDRIEKQYGKDLGLGQLRDFLSSPDTPWNAGSLKAWSMSMDWEKALSHNIVGDVSDALDEMIAKHKIDENVADDITAMSHGQRKLLDKQISLAVKQLALVGAQTANLKSSTKVNEKELEKMREEITKLQKEQTYITQQEAESKSRTQQIKNQDYRSKYLTGDYKGTAAVLGLDGLHSLLNLLGFFASKGK